MMPLFLAAAVPAALPANTDSRVLHYAVKKDDSLFNLASRYFTSSGVIARVMAQNGMREPRKLRLNETLLIPYSVLRWTPVNGEVISFRGAVRIGERSVAVGNRIDEGTRIETAADSFVAFRFPDGTLTTLPSNSRVRAISMRRYVMTGEVDRRFVVERGGSEWKVTPSTRNGDRFEVGTPVATTAVRGTEFRVTYAEQGSQSGTGVVKGEVGFSTPKTSEPTALPGGFGAVTDTSGSVDKRQLLAGPELAKGYAVQRKSKLEFNALPVPAAQSYLFEIANDSSFLDPVQTIRSSGTQANLADLADGNYFLRVSALDNANLQGLSRTYAFSRKLLELGAAADGASGRLKFAWTKGPTATVGYRFTLSNNENLANPLVDTMAAESQVSVGPLAPGKYFWRVVTIKTDGDDPSDVQTFEIGE